MQFQKNRWVNMTGIARNIKSSVIKMFRVFFNDIGIAVPIIYLLFLFILALAADYIAPYPYNEINLKNKLQPPNLQHLMGTDHLGRDILSRIIHGTRPLIYVMAMVLLIALSSGTLIGLLSGYIGGWIDITISRLIDMAMVFPPILIALAIVAVLGTGLEKVIIAIGIAEIPVFARLARSLVIVEKEQLYVEAAKALGASSLRIMLFHILPNIIGPILVQATFSASSAILWEAALSFLGLGAQPPIPSWGLMLYEAKAYFRLHPHTALFPGLALFIAVFMINTLGENLMIRLDPRYKTVLK